MSVWHSEIFNNLYYPSKPPGTQGLPHSDPAYFQAIFLLAFILSPPPTPHSPQAIRNVGHHPNTPGFSLLWPFLKLFPVLQMSFDILPFLLPN